jgi:hypothetical protein
MMVWAEERREKGQTLRKRIGMFFACFLVTGGMLVSGGGTSQAEAQPAFVVTRLQGSATAPVTFTEDPAVYAAAVLYVEGFPFVVKGRNVRGVWARLQVRGMMSVSGAAQLEQELLKIAGVWDARVLFFSDRADVLVRSASVIPRVVARLRADAAQWPYPRDVRVVATRLVSAGYHFPQSLAWPTVGRIIAIREHVVPRHGATAGGFPVTLSQIDDFIRYDDRVSDLSPKQIHTVVAALRFSFVCCPPATAWPG